MQFIALFLCLMLLVPLPSYSMEAPSIETASILDTATTAIAINNGARELNPLGFPVATAIKFLILIPYVNNIEDEAQRKNTSNFFSSVFTGAAVNNVAVMLGASPIVSLGAGILTYIELRNK